MEQRGRHFTDTQLEEFETALNGRRDDILHQLGRVDGNLVDVRDARGNGVADDEHDPEGPTMSSEWSRLSGTHEALEADLASVEAARDRLSAGDYGFCTRCGNRIGIERLRARPEAGLCIDCASIQR
jgi:RNA polymerase-binding transcription factor DksA